MENFKSDYNQLRKSLESFHEELRRQIRTIIREENINLAFPVQSRVKSWKSVSEKLERLDRNFSDLKEMQDLVGIRIVTMFEEDLEKISTSLDNIFVIEREYNTADRLKKDQFGYSSIHKIILLPDQWLNLPTLQTANGLNAELQIRTASQHIWAEASQILN